MKKQLGTMSILCFFAISAVSFAESHVDEHGNAIIGTRTHSAVFNVGGTLEAFLVGLSENEVNRIVPGSMDFLNIVQPYDAEKTAGMADGCGLATIANMLAYTGWGDVNDFKTADDIFAYYCTTRFPDVVGLYAGVEWFITGNYSVQRHFPDIDVTPFINKGGFHPRVNYQTIAKVNENIRDVANITNIVNLLKTGGAIGLIIEWRERPGLPRFATHAMPVWGVIYDTAKRPTDRGYYTALLVNCSANHHGMGVQAPNVLQCYAIEWNNSIRRYNMDYMYDGKAAELWYYYALAPRPDYRQRLIRNHRRLDGTSQTITEPITVEKDNPVTHSAPALALRTPPTLGIATIPAGSPQHRGRKSAL